MHEALKRLRLEKGWSQTQLARRSGVSQTYISELEAGKSDPTVSVAKKLARALGVPVAQLVGESAPAAVGGVGGGGVTDERSRESA